MPFLIFAGLSAAGFFWLRRVTRAPDLGGGRVALRREYFARSRLSRPAAERAMKDAVAAMRRRYPDRSPDWLLNRVLVELRETR